MGQVEMGLRARVPPLSASTSHAFLSESWAARLTLLRPLKILARDFLLRRARAYAGLETERAEFHRAATRHRDPAWDRSQPESDESAQRHPAWREVVERSPPA